MTNQQQRIGFRNIPDKKDLETGEVLSEKLEVYDIDTGFALTQEESQVYLDDRHRSIKDDVAYNLWFADLTHTENKTHLAKNKPKVPPPFTTVKFNFNQMNRDELQKIYSDNKLDVCSLAFLGRFMPYVMQFHNYILVDNSFPTAGEFAKIMNVNRNKIFIAFDKMEDLQIIKRVKFGHNNNIIYVCPYLFNAGRINISTLELFKDSPYEAKE